MCKAPFQGEGNFLFFSLPDSWIVGDETNGIDFQVGNKLPCSAFVPIS